MQIPATGAWQSFTPSWAGNLTTVHLLLGASLPASPCVPFVGQLSIYAGTGETNGDYFLGRTPLLSQSVVSSECVCTSQVGCEFGFAQVLL